MRNFNPTLFRLYVLLIVTSTFLPAEVMGQVQAQVSEDGAWFMEGTDTILYYQAAEKSLNGTYARANYIHPLYSLDGMVLTEDFPEDHLHQRGIFWAWHQLYVAGKRIGDGWETKDLHWDVRQLSLERGTGDGALLVSTVDWKSPLWTDPSDTPLVLIRETTQIEVMPRLEDYRLINIRIQMQPQYEDVRLGGSEDAKGYGGFSARIRLPEGMVFSSSEGLVAPQNLPVEAGPWMDISGPLGSDNATAGITIIADPMNPGYPHPWILRSKNSMQNPVFPHPGKEAIPLSKRDPLVLKYQLVIHGNLSRERLLEIVER